MTIPYWEYLLRVKWLADGRACLYTWLGLLLKTDEYHGSTDGVLFSNN